MIANDPTRSKMATYPNDEDVFFNAESRLVYQSATFTNRFINAMRPFNVQRLPEIIMLIYEAINSKNKEISDCFQLLVEDIFSTDKDTHWNLIVQHNVQHHDEFNQLYSFLSADGELFNLIKFLMSDPSLKYLFPVSKLSAPTKQLIEQGSAPNFYLNKLCTETMTIYPTKIQLNPFEFFFFHFAHYIKDLITSDLVTNDLTPILEFGKKEQIKLLYLSLLENYLIKFLPTTNHNKCLNELNTSNTQNSLWQSLSSTTSNLLHLGAHNPNKSLAAQKPQNDSSKQTEESIDSVGSVVYKCETVINILTEMWLNIRIPSKLNKEKPNSASLIKDYSHIICMIVVRMFIKRVHCLANSLTDKSLEMGNMPTFENHELDEIKKSVWTSKYQIPKRFYSFLKLSFEHWPCDSFRVPLETWLSYIQPWDCLEITGDPTATSLQNLNKWKGFIQENILFYTTIYKEILDRFVNFDLTSLSNANILFWVIKVYSELNLRDLIREAEANCETTSSTNLLEIKVIVIKLLANIRETIENLELLEAASPVNSTENKSRVQLYNKLCRTKLKPEDVPRTRSFLRMAGIKLAQLYEIDPSTVRTEERLDNAGVFGDMLLRNSGGRFDEIELDEAMVFAEQFRQAFEVKFEENGNPDLKPVQKHELYHPTCIFISLSDLINGYYQETFKRAYESDGLVGWLAKLLLAGPETYKVLDTNGKMIRKKLEPRVNLRFIGSKKVHAYMALFTLLPILSNSEWLPSIYLWTFFFGTTILIQLFL